jgi:hypothetical protein
MMLYQENIAPPGSPPAASEPSDVLSLRRSMISLEQENAWLKAQMARIVPQK